MRRRNRSTSKHSGKSAKVLFVDHETRLSGGERDLVDLVRALPAGLEIHCALPGRGPLWDALEAQSVRLHRFRLEPGLAGLSRWELARRPLSVLRVALSAARATASLTGVIRRVEPDVVHTNSMKAHLLALVGARAGRAALVWHVRDILVGSWLARSFQTAARWGPDLVLCLSAAGAEPFRGGAARAKTRVVYNGIRLAPVEPAAVAEFRARAGAPADQFLVAMVGQIAQWKGQDLFVEAAGRLAGEHPDMRFAIVGACLFPDNEGAFAEQVRARAAALGLAGRLVWCGWSEEVEPVMHGIDLLVHQSRLDEPFGRVMIEALAAGKPVVASTRGAGPELVTPDVAVLVEPGDVEALAGAIAELAARSRSDPDLAGKARRQAGRFDIDRCAGQVLDAYRELGIGPVPESDALTPAQ